MEDFINYIIREYREEDLTWIVNTHRELYSREYGFDDTFPNYVREPLDRFHSTRKMDREKIWIVEESGRNVGVIAIAYVDDDTAQLRWFLLEEDYRGKGIGNKLMETAVDFSMAAGYGKIILWTVSQLDAARHLYRKFGFQIMEQIPHKIWGQQLTEERWDLIIDPAEK
ncbi:MAG: GNAT family N-acetyltransferase [Bacillota bacterium]